MHSRFAVTNRVHKHTGHSFSVVHRYDRRANEQDVNWRLRD